MLLTNEEIISLTGAEKPSKQIQVLERNRISYIGKLNGSPAITWEAVNSAMVVKKSCTTDDGDENFNLGAIK